MTTSEHSQPMLAHPFPFPAFAINAGAPFYFPDSIVLEICASSSWKPVKRQLVAGVYVARGHVFSPPAGFLERPTLFVGRRAHVA